MASSQQFLFASDKPLVRRLGKKFFQWIPCRPGVYKMHNVQGNIVYVGKAKDLRQRLADYRIANPEKLPKRRLRLLREVALIKFDLGRRAKTPSDVSSKRGILLRASAAAGISFLIRSVSVCKLVRLRIWEHLPLKPVQLNMKLKQTLGLALVLGGIFLVFSSSANNTNTRHSRRIHTLL